MFLDILKGKLQLDAPTPWGLFFQDSASPQIWSGKSLAGCKLPNSGDSLKLLIPSYSRKAISGWSNYSGKVTSLKIGENQMDNRGSKSAICESIAVKEQRVDGSWSIKRNLMDLRCTLEGFERNRGKKTRFQHAKLKFLCQNPI